MNRRILTIAMATCLSVLTVQPVMAAPMSGMFHRAADKSTKKTVKFQIRNDCKSALTISTGGQQYTVQPHRVISLKLEEGTMVTAVTGTDHVQAGTVLTTVTTGMQDSTLAIS